MTDSEKKELELSQKKTIEQTDGEPTREGVMYVPEVDILEDADTITLLADLPGVSKDQLNIDVRDDTLTLTAGIEPSPTHLRPVYQEYELGGYRRRFSLGERVDQENISAKLDNGVLTLVLPKMERVKPRKVEIS